MTNDGQPDPILDMAWLYLLTRGPGVNLLTVDGEQGECYGAFQTEASGIAYGRDVLKLKGFALIQLEPFEAFSMALKADLCGIAMQCSDGDWKFWYAEAQS